MGKSLTRLKKGNASKGNTGAASSAPVTESQSISNQPSSQSPRRVNATSDPENAVLDRETASGDSTVENDHQLTKEQKSEENASSTSSATVPSTYVETPLRRIHPSERREEALKVTRRLFK